MLGGELDLLAADSARKLHVSRHDGHALGMNGAEVGVLEQPNQVSFCGLLQGSDGCRLEADVVVEGVRNLADQTLEWQFAQKQITGLLVSANFSQRNRSRAVAMRLLHASHAGCTLTRGLGGEVLAGCFASMALSSRLLGACHDVFEMWQEAADMI